MQHEHTATGPATETLSHLHIITTLANDNRALLAPKTGGFLPTCKFKSQFPAHDRRGQKIKHTPLRSLANNIWGLVRGKTALNTCLIIHTINKKVSHFLNNLDVS